MDMEVCMKCARFFLNKEYLNKHEKEESKCEHRCMNCLKYYLTKNSLEEHQKLKCEQKFECGRCSEKYNTKVEHKQHLCKEDEEVNEEECYKAKMKYMNEQNITEEEFENLKKLQVEKYKTLTFMIKYIETMESK
jgi:hypothetical protein